MVRKLLAVAMLMTLFGVTAPNNAKARTQGVNELTIWWANWIPADILQLIGDQYEKETGIQVTVVQESWDNYYHKVKVAWETNDDSFDMIVGSPQWLGQAVEANHYVDLTDFLNRNGITETVIPTMLQYYAEYPTNSDTYYAYPIESDAVGWAYRRDLFENPDNQVTFENTYGYPLAVPETWDQLRDLAEFFTRLNEGLYGVGIFTDTVRGGITAGFENALFSYGADWKDADNQVMGVLNSPNAIAALELYAEIYQFTPPDMENAFIAEINNAFVTGQAAMVMNYFAFFTALDIPETNPYRDFTGYFVMPAGPTGERFAALGGQGISVNSPISDERKQASLNFIQWFASERVQTDWATMGGHTCNVNLFESEAFLTQAPYHPALVETMTSVKGFWNIPQADLLLEPAQHYLHAYVVEGQGTAEETLTYITAEMEDILIREGITRN